MVDDGSTDNTRQLVSANYPDVHLLSQPNQGVSAARNAGIRASRGDWLAFLDSDDAWFAEKIQRQIEGLAKAPAMRIVHTDEVWIRDGVRINQMKKHKKYGGALFQYCLPLCVISPSSVMIHRSVFAEVGLFDESLPVCEDYDLWLRVCARMPVLFIDEVLVIKYGGHADQLSKKYRGMDRYRIQAIHNILNEINLPPPDKEKAIATLVKKLTIYLNGARKHNNTRALGQFESMLAEYEPQLSGQI